MSDSSEEWEGARFRAASRRSPGSNRSDLWLRHTPFCGWRTGCMPWRYVAGAFLCTPGTPQVHPRYTRPTPQRAGRLGRYLNHIEGLRLDTDASLKRALSSPSKTSTVGLT